MSGRGKKQVLGETESALKWPLEGGEACKEPLGPSSDGLGWGSLAEVIVVGLWWGWQGQAG